MSPTRRDAVRAGLEKELAAIIGECSRVAEAIGRGGPMDVLLDRLTAQQVRRHEIEIQLAQPVARVATCDLRSLESQLRAKLEDWQALLIQNVADARAVLRTLLVGPLRFSPLLDERRRAYRFEGAIALDRLVAGVVDLPTKMASPTGSDGQWHLPFRGISDPADRPTA